METKRECLEKAARGEGCLGKAADNEPVFILRAQDLHSDFAVQEWAKCAAVVLGYDHPKVQGALECARAMKKWPIRKLPD